MNSINTYYKIGLLMFGVYSCIMLVVLINMLIAMMNNSYQAIAVNWMIFSIWYFVKFSLSQNFILKNQSDEEWKVGY